VSEAGTASVRLPTLVSKSDSLSRVPRVASVVAPVGRGRVAADTGTVSWSDASTTDMDAALAFWPMVKGNRRIRLVISWAIRWVRPLSPLEAVSVPGAASVTLPSSVLWACCSARVEAPAGSAIPEIPTWRFPRPSVLSVRISVPSQPATGTGLTVGGAPSASCPWVIPETSGLPNESTRTVSMRYGKLGFAPGTSTSYVDGPAAATPEAATGPVPPSGYPFTRLRCCRARAREGSRQSGRHGSGHGNTGSWSHPGLPRMGLEQIGVSRCRPRR
jgi:hypothetical protein